jgi:diguanylate cyclase (GGDEF)-like protein
VSRLKAVFRSTASVCALALLMLVALAAGTALGADQGPAGDVAKAVGPSGPVGPEKLSQGLVDGAAGNSGVDLDQLLAPLLTEPDPANGGGQQVAPTTSNTPSVDAQPAASAPKTKTPKRKIADARSSRSPGAAATRSAPQGRDVKTRPQQQPEVRDQATSSRAEKIARSNVHQPEERPASPSIVSKVINRIPAEYKIALAALGLLSVLFALVSLRERRRSRRVERQALVDALTALPNRQAFERRLAKEWRRAERYERSIGVLMLDLDDFKQINDGQGHAAGDRVLREAAALISGRIRSADMAARWGGDEFVVLCPETNATGLRVLARSLEDRLKHAGIASSAGFAERESGDLGPSDLLARADVSMYARKQRDRARPERRASTLVDARSSFASLSD